MNADRNKKGEGINIAIRNMLRNNQFQTDALCLEEVNFDTTAINVENFTEDINLEDYLICHHQKKNQCKYGISFGLSIICSCLSVVNLRKK